MAALQACKGLKRNAGRAPPGLTIGCLLLRRHARMGMVVRAITGVVMSDDSKQVRRGPAGPKLSELADATGMGLDRKIGLTVFDTFVRPGRAAQAAFDRAPTHISPLKLFMGLGGVFLSVGAIFGAPMTASLESLLPQAGLQAGLDNIAAQGGDASVINASLSQWSGLLAWPLTLIASAVFIVVLKIARPSVTWYGHILIYLIATNAMTLAAIPLVAARLVSLELYLTLQLSTLVIFFVQMMRLGSSALELGAGRLILLFMLIAIAVFPALLISGLLQLASVWMILSLHGVSFPEMMAAANEAASAARGAS
jgi:hypothetical protein